MTSIVFGVTGGIAAYKSAILLRLLVGQNYDVQVVMTGAACHFITPVTLQALSGKPVFTDLWDAGVTNNMAHIKLGRAADAIVVAPASADFIAKLANGLADDLLSTLCLARNCPLLIAPAMNREMWQNAAVQRNVAQLEGDGVHILGPDCGIQACGEEGWGRMLAPETLSQLIHDFFQPKLLAGVTILMTAGPTYEAIDAVRGITNRSSGKMGYAIAQAALEMGAGVVLVSGPTTLSSPLHAVKIDVQSALQMYDAVKQHVASCDIFIAVAAVADYRVAQPCVQKIKKSTAPLTLTLIANPDILAYVASLAEPPYCVGFAAESENLAEFAEQKRLAKRLPLLVGNIAGVAIGSDDNELTLFDDNGMHPLPRADKLTLARQLMLHIAQHYKGEN
jgi:phosphopantothenoylcysteine decarboxylase/phosphopantothenate--cysteine ligase